MALTKSLSNSLLFANVRPPTIYAPRVLKWQLPTTIGLIAFKVIPRFRFICKADSETEHYPHGFAENSSLVFAAVNTFLH
jgi:hypothetical protein